VSAPLTDASVLCPAQNIVWREVAGEVVLLNPMHDVIMGLNGCGGESWKLLDGQRRLVDIAAAIAEQFENTTPEQVLADVIAFAEVLLDRGLANIAP